MLNYHPSGDVFHCIYRILLLAHKSKLSSIESDRLRLMDFYFMFPNLLQNLKVPREYLKLKKVFKGIAPPYEEMAAPKRLYFQLEPIQKNAIRSLVAKGYFDHSIYSEKSQVKLVKALPKKILHLFDQDEKVNGDWFLPFVSLFSEIQLSGESGLKLRSSMMEYRYDTT